MKKLVLAGVIALWPGMAQAGPVVVEAEDAADHHVAAQGNYRGGLPSSWEWKLGSKKSGKNITGISAQGLLAAYQLTKLEEHQRSAIQAAKSLIRAYDRGWRHIRPFTQDIEFLAAAGFPIDAGRWFRVTTGRYSPAAYVDMVLQGRKKSGHSAIAGWDIASAIRAAIAVGEINYAKGLLVELLRRQGEWDINKPGRDLSRGSLLWAMAQLRDRAGLTPEQHRVAAGLRSALQTAQQSSGSWLGSPRGSICTQTTAYAILGLSRFKEGLSSAKRGRRWLTRSAISDRRFYFGGRMWATTYTKSGSPKNNYVAEIQSEAMMALATGR